MLYEGKFTILGIASSTTIVFVVSFCLTYGPYRVYIVPNWVPFRIVGEPELDGWAPGGPGAREPAGRAEQRGLMSYHKMHFFVELFFYWKWVLLVHTCG